jgi:propane monooxygenase reductase subunit
MPGKDIYTVRFEPVGVEMEVEEGETVLDAAFRQGVALMHGCKEGQCASCKAILVEGDMELLKYSTFALSDPERETDHILLCRTQAYSDLEIELLNYDEELLSRSIPVRDYAAQISAIDALTHDIFRLEVEIDAPLKFWAGQYVDITVPGQDITRAFSMANPPGEGRRLAFIIRKYPDGAFSALLDGGLNVGDALTLKGPYGMCFRREDRPGPMLLIGGGSGMSPLWSILHDLMDSGEQRQVTFFYGARARRDLFYLDELAAITRAYPGFTFVPALSEPDPADGWDGETGFIHEVVARHLREMIAAGQDGGEVDAYACGPPPMIDAVLPVLQMNDVEPERIYFDKFTPSLAAVVPAPSEPGGLSLLQFNQQS